MKKVLSKSKLSNPSKFVRRVLSRTSNASRKSEEENIKSESQTSISENMKIKPNEADLEVELTSLREQLSILQVAVTSMQEDAEKREETLASLAREKQQLSTDLRREKRSSTSLKQQLDDERGFYYKEKEQYCNEMNDFKKLKKKISETSHKKKGVVKEDSKEVVECKSQISKLKTALNQTLAANYNLSVKFLRMKNTKISLKNRLEKQESEHEKAMKNLLLKISGIKTDIADIVDKRFMLPISPSNKRFLQIIKQNGILMHENLCLQMEVDRLSAKLESVKSANRNKESRNKVQPSLQTSKPKPGNSKKISSKPEKESQNKAKPKMNKNDQNLKVKKEAKRTSTQDDKTCNIQKENVIKIFEREETEGTPDIIMLPQDGGQSDILEKAKELTDVTDKIICSKSSGRNSLVQISENPSQMDTELSYFSHTTASREAIRTQSAPEIVQTSLFVSILKS